MRTRSRLAAGAAMVALSVMAPGSASAATLPLVTSWGGAPSTAPGSFTQLEDVSVGPNGDVFTIENGGGAADRVQRFSAVGAPLQPPFGSEGTGAGQFRQPLSLVVSPAAEVFVADLFKVNGEGGKVLRFQADGTGPTEWGVNGSAAGQFNFPEGVAFGSGTVYVADRGNNQVDRYGVSGAFVNEWGGSGAGPGFFNRIIEVSVSPAGDLYAVDRDNGRIQRFSAAGAFIAIYGSPGSANGQIGTASDVAVDSAGDVWVGDTLNSRIVRYAANGAFKANYDKVGALSFRPVGLSFAPNGDLLIADVFPGTYRVIRAKTTGAGGGGGGGGGGVALPAPVLGRKVNAKPVKGKVLVSVPGGAARTSASVPGLKGRKFVPLTAARQIPVGSFFDTRKGSVRVTSASTTTGKTYSGDFGAGVFQALQSRTRRLKGLTTLRLKGGNFRTRCRSRRRSRRATTTRRKRKRLSRRTVRRLKSNAKGRFRTSGRYSSATVRGTSWTTSDRCDGTLTKVTRGTVVVRARKRKKKIVLKRGKSYLARAPGG